MDTPIVLLIIVVCMCIVFLPKLKTPTRGLGREVFGFFLLFALVLLIVIPARGFLIASYWGWFVAPLWGVRRITIAESIGISMFLGILGVIPYRDTGIFDFDWNGSWQERLTRGIGVVAMIGIVLPAIFYAVGLIWYESFIAPP